MRRWSRRIAVLLLLSLVAGVPAGAKKARSQKRPEAAEVTNFQLGLDYSHWLVGPIYFIASDEERRQYLALSTDTAAETFIEEFWKRRNPAGSDFFGNDLRRLFDERVAEADKRYREGVTLGRNTDRGAIYTVYGEPESVEYDVSLKPREPDLEIWTYPRDASEGLDGAPPKRRYWFAERDGRVVLHVPKATRRNTMVDQRN